MSTKFPINPVEFVHAIQSDAPATYDYLIDEWNLWNASDKEQPEPEDILAILENYSGNNHDTHWWAWRLSVLKELITIPEPKTPTDIDTYHIAEFLNDMTRIHYGYTLIRCEVCDTPQRMYQEWEDLKPGSQLTHCHCWQKLDHDHPDLFY